MNAIVPIAMFGWPLVVLCLFAVLPKHRAVIVAFIVAWLFLPVVHDAVLGLRLTKMRATCWPVLIAVLLLDIDRLWSFRPRWVDLPVAAWCVSPFFSSLANDLGPYDACSQALDQIVAWGIPYLMGRLYLSSLDRLRDLGIGLICSGLVYTPLCLLEIRLSPQLHTWVYGYFPHSSFGQSIRYGGFRPTVFMEHGLAVGAWMCTVALAAFWSWRSGAIAKFPLFPGRTASAVIAAILLVILVLSRSVGSLGLALIGAVALLISSWSRTRIAVFVLLLIPVSYAYARVWGGWTGTGVADAVGRFIDRERAQSFEFRLMNENLLIGKALESPLFGWGGWGRSHVYDSEGVDLTIVDGLWIIVFGNNGVFGLLAVGLAIGLPAALVFIALPAKSWTSPDLAIPVVLAMSLVLYFIDDIANAMINPVFMLIAGGLNSTLGQHVPAARISRRTPMVRAQVKYGPAPTALETTSALVDLGVD
jgi:hypothetical protein